MTREQDSFNGLRIMKGRELAKKGIDIFSFVTVQLDNPQIARRSTALYRNFLEALISPEGPELQLHTILLLTVLNSLLPISNNSALLTSIVPVHGGDRLEIPVHDVELNNASPGRFFIDVTESSGERFQIAVPQIQHTPPTVQSLDQLSEESTTSKKKNKRVINALTNGQRKVKKRLEQEKKEHERIHTLNQTVGVVKKIVSAYTDGVRTIQIYINDFPSPGSDSYPSMFLIESHNMSLCYGIPLGGYTIKGLKLAIEGMSEVNSDDIVTEGSISYLVEA